MPWSGKIPKVACITGISGSHHTKARIMYFVNNFRLQNYEGARELIFVYHHTDTSAAELIRPYVDDNLIKGVASFGENVFPSTTALRYGAWSTDADVIARWDFEEWHDPSRLSIQIRAMASTSRPACVIRVPTKNNSQSSNISSLVGEKLWMTRHWHPCSLADDIIPRRQAARVVAVDMQSDQGSTAGIKENTNDSLAQVNTTLNEQATECSKLDESKNTSYSWQNLEARLGDEVDADMSRQFRRLMSRRHNLAEKLQLLCMQSVIEENANKKAFKKQHMDHLLGLRSDLDKHIAAISELFAA